MRPRRQRQRSKESEAVRVLSLDTSGVVVGFPCQVQVDRAVRGDIRARGCETENGLGNTVAVHVGKVRLYGPVWKIGRSVGVGVAMVKKDFDIMGGYEMSVNVDFPVGHDTMVTVSLTAGMDKALAFVNVLYSAIEEQSMAIHACSIFFASGQ